MRAFISISNRVTALLLLTTLAAAPRARADEPPAAAGTDKTLQPEEDDFSKTPYTRYGEFNSDKEEEEDTRFFQNGRFFGVSLGAGFEAVSGNRGALYQGGFPLFDVRVHYWFDFNFALDLGIFVVNHYFNDTTTSPASRYDVNIFHLGVDLKYYFDTSDLSAPISFASPFILVGAGPYVKNETNQATQTNSSDTEMGVSAGAGLEFVLKPKSTYFDLEGKIHVVNYKDSGHASFNGLPDLSGHFFTVVGSFLFTW